MENIDPLIRTKLHLPFIRQGLVSRSRLQEKIAHGLRGLLTLVEAPAGFGKTTLLASCLADFGIPIAWLSLDKNDNQMGTFLSYLIAAIKKANNKIGNEASQLLAAPETAAPEIILTSLINDLDDAGGEIALVLDDYQFMSNKAVHETMTFLLEHCPNTLHLVLASRSDPPLPLARLRARGQVTELRIADLRFTQDETAQFLNGAMSLRLDHRSIAALEERTEGWIAGLQMAALSMHNRADITGFVENFSGTNRYILDYLVEEVLAKQPPEVKRFLLYTSILERLTAPLCDYIVEISEHSINDMFQPSNEVLEYLERANLFLLPLDDERQWYRYHHLFADLLHARLDQIFPGEAIQLHGRAAAWFAQAGLYVEAINHALAAGEYNHATTLVEENTTRLLAQGELNALMGWIEALPEKLRKARPWLCVHQAYALTFAGRLAEVPILLNQAETTLEKMAAPDEILATNKPDEMGNPAIDRNEVPVLTGAIAAIRAMVAVMTGQDATAVTQAEHAREVLPAENLWDRAAAAWALGYALRSLGRLPEAQAAFEEQIRLGRVMGNIWTLVTGLDDLAQVNKSLGKLRQARALFEEALSEASRQGARSLGYIARMEAGLASVLYEQNELDPAQHLLAEAIAHTRLWPNPNHLVYAYTLQARLLLAHGDLQGARTTIDEASRVSRSARLTRIVRRMEETELVRVWLALQASVAQLDAGDTLVSQASELITAWQDDLVGSLKNISPPMDEASEMAALAIVRTSLSAKHYEDALELLEPFVRNAQSSGHVGIHIAALVLTAIASQGKKAEGVARTSRPVQAFKALEEALHLATAAGYVRIFLDEGQPMRMLLAQWLAQANASRLREYASYLLSQFEAGSRENAEQVEKASPASSLIETISPRELEVIHLMALGMTNLEIAQQLIVSRGTIKAHAASIYRKLDVTNRTQAVARARQLGILP
jgi:LuxR family maltose regulon positive regulatory protein